MAKQAVEPKEAPEPQEPKTPADKITGQILVKLGKPPRYDKTEIKTVGLNTYRANIYVSRQHEFKDIVACMPMLKISDSFYVSTDNEGQITEVKPSIVRKY
jgi:hypothetical protein